MFTMEGNGVGVEIKGVSTTEEKVSHGIEPKPKHLWVAAAIDSATILGEKSTLGNPVEPGKKGETFIKDIAHDMTVAVIAKEFESEHRAYGVPNRNHLAAWKTSILQQLVEGDLRKVRQEEEQAPKASPKSSMREV
jgi:hypothetical protein